MVNTISLRLNYRSKRRMRDGYVEIYEPTHPLARPDGYVFEHRKVAFDAGLPVTRKLHVHHINHNKTDNRLENLEVLEIRQHALRHANDDGVVANQYGVWPVGKGWHRRHRLRVEEQQPRLCAYCGADISHRNFSALTCNTQCAGKLWRIRNKEYHRIIRNAGAALIYAVKIGKLIRPDTCESCGKQGNIQAAHKDYKRPLDVIWLCRSCHTKWDRFESKRPSSLETAKPDPIGLWTSWNGKITPHHERAHENIFYCTFMFYGQSKTLYEWSNEIGIKPITLLTRLRRGWPVEQALHRALDTRGSYSKIKDC